MEQRRKFSLGLSLGLLLGICAAQVFAQNAGCAGKEREAVLPSGAKVYRDAVALSEALGKNGILVICIMGSKMEGTFDGQTGAAAYRSNHGNFEVLFLPQTATFNQLKIVEKRDGERYSYRFNGPPEPWPANLINSSHRVYFIKDRNILFVIDGDAELAARFQKLVGSQH